MNIQKNWFLFTSLVLLLIAVIGFMVQSLWLLIIVAVSLIVTLIVRFSHLRR